MPMVADGNHDVDECVGRTSGRLVFALLLCSTLVAASDVSAQDSRPPFPYDDIPACREAFKRLTAGTIGEDVERWAAELRACEYARAIRSREQESRNRWELSAIWKELGVLRQRQADDVQGGLWSTETIVSALAVVVAILAWLARTRANAVAESTARVQIFRDLRSSFAEFRHELPPELAAWKYIESVDGEHMDEWLVQRFGSPSLRFDAVAPSELKVALEKEAKISARPPEEVAMRKLLHLSFDEWFITNRLDRKTFGHLWDRYYKQVLQSFVTEDTKRLLNDMGLWEDKSEDRKFKEAFNLKFSDDGADLGEKARVP